MTASQPITIDVFSIMVKPPQFQSIPAASATAGQAFSFNASAYASDPNTPALTLTYKLGSGHSRGEHQRDNRRLDLDAARKPAKRAGVDHDHRF